MKQNQLRGWTAKPVSVIQSARGAKVVLIASNTYTLTTATELRLPGATVVNGSHLFMRPMTLTITGTSSDTHEHCR